MSDITPQSSSSEREATNSFLLIGIVAAFILLIIGLLIYSYVAGRPENNTNLVTTDQRDNTIDTNDEDEDLPVSMPDSQ